jgi:hypothetical protein
LTTITADCITLKNEPTALAQAYLDFFAGG